MKRSLRVRYGSTFIIDTLLALIIFISAGLFRVDDVLLVTYMLIIPYLILTKRKNIFYYLMVASLISFMWMIVSKNYYYNNSYYLHSIGINLYPMLAWGLGLTGSYLFYTYFRKKLRVEGFYKQLSLYLISYWPLLILFETVGYHFLNIRNPVTASYPGLPICDCIHAPYWMQIVYFSMGPTFFIVSYILRKFQKGIFSTIQKVLIFKGEVI